MPGFSFTNEARADLADIDAYTTERWGEGQATKYLRGLYRRVGALAGRPRLGRLRSELGPDVRSALYEAHVIIYQGTDEILVPRVAHQAEDVRPP